MKTNRLSNRIQDALNKQVTNEAEAAQIYIYHLPHGHPVKDTPVFQISCSDMLPKNVAT